MLRLLIGGGEGELVTHAYAYDLESVHLDYPKGRKSSLQIKFAISPIPVASSVNLSSAFHKIE